MSAMTTHHFEEHTSEVRLCVAAPTLAGLFEQAGRALAELMLDSTAVPGAEGVERAEPAEPVHLRAPDRAMLLVDWLNELIFLSETRKRVYTEIHVESVSDTALAASVRGVFPDVLRTAVKAATLHEVEVLVGPGGCTAKVVLDV
jgi:SHS2 domain-containing protein